MGESFYNNNKIEREKSDYIPAVNACSIEENKMLRPVPTQFPNRYCIFLVFSFYLYIVHIYMVSYIHKQS